MGLVRGMAAARIRRRRSFNSCATLTIVREPFSSFAPRRFRKLGGFDEAYAPAYYEEVDFCCRLWQEGFRIVYDPKVVIRHFEFASSSREEAALAMQVRNRAIFCVRQAEFLAGQSSRDTRNLLAARSQSAASARVLIIEDRVPHPYLGSGYPRSMEMVQANRASNRFVTFYPLLVSGR